MARKAKIHIQTYYDLQKLSAEQRATKVEWLLEKDRFTCPAELRQVSMPLNN
jgi:hypothetical protein